MQIGERCWLQLLGIHKTEIVYFGLSVAKRTEGRGTH